MIDSHTHILPKIDDGSRSETQSAEMLRCLSKQGITVLAATPHFYPTYTSPSAFLEAREQSAEKLLALPEAEKPDIRIGAEVLYYEGIQNMSQLPQLCISGTSLLLLELPLGRWSERTVRGIADLCTDNSFRVVLAHVDRYFGMQNRAVFEHLAESGAYMQLNYDAFFKFRTRLRALEMIKRGMIQLLGSDCHSAADCRRDVNTVSEIIEKKLGRGELEKLNYYAECLFNTGD